MTFRGYIFFFFVIFTLVCYFLTITSGCLLKKWTISITNKIPDDIVVHIKSSDHDLGNHTISYNGVYTWHFCAKLVGTHYTGEFSWFSRRQTVDLMDTKVWLRCSSRLVGDDDCYWMVIPVGFYVSFHNGTISLGINKYNNIYKYELRAK
ncbi:hypothetical protein LXL04_028789 [Taraxacum kok-saghyz]